MSRRLITVVLVEDNAANASNVCWILETRVWLGDRDAVLAANAGKEDKRWSFDVQVVERVFRLTSCKKELNGRVVHCRIDTAARNYW